MKSIVRVALQLAMTLLFMTISTSAQAQGGGNMKIASSAFEHNQSIPKKYTCQGDDINPPLEISGIPPQTKSLAIIVDDPDAPGGMWVHWVIFNIPTPEGPVLIIPESSVPGDQGYNDFNRYDYGGPCPPSGTHRYFFKIYALDLEPGLLVEQPFNKVNLEDYMAGHILAQAQLVGTFKK